MSNAAVAGDDLSGAVARLDQDIVETERRLAELRAMRESIQGFLERYVEAGQAVPDPGPQTPTAPTRLSITDEVVRVFQMQEPGAVLDVDEVLKHLRDNGIDAKHDATRNAIYYAVRSKRLHKERRGRFTLKDTSTPAATGVEDNGEPYEGSPREIGGGRDGSSTLAGGGRESAFGNE
jgi:hypothetical protein